jgi:DNA invertase Pin-like site-specific DNA recombinase
MIVDRPTAMRCSCWKPISAETNISPTGSSVWKLDRFARSLRHLVNALAELEALGVAFVSLKDNVDLSTPSGRLMVQIIGAMAEFERSLIAERVKAGLQNARRRGKRLGRRRVLVNVQEVAEMASQGLSGRAIAKVSGVSEATMRRILRSSSGKSSTTGDDAVRTVV